MPAMTVTATQTANGANGMLLRVYVLTGAAPVASQAGGSVNTAYATNTNTWTLSITTTTGSNVYGAAAPSPSGTTQTGVSATPVDTVADSTNGMAYCTFKALNVTTGPTTRGFTCGGAAGALAIQEILASGTLAEDASAPPVASNTNALTQSSASFTPPGGSLLVAVVSTDGTTGAVTVDVTDNLGAHLNWTQKAFNNAAAADYAGIWIADVPASGTTVTPGSADGTGAAYAGTPQYGLSAGPLWAGTATGVSGSWAGTGNAVGSGQGDYATWTDSAAGSSAVLELAAFDAQSSVPAGSTVNSVSCTVRHGETPASAVASVTAQAYSGTTPVGSPQALTAADAVHDDQVTFTGLAYADLADLRVRVTVTRD